MNKLLNPKNDVVFQKIFGVEYFNRFEPLVRSTLSHIDALNEPPSRQ